MSRGFYESCKHAHSFTLSLPDQLTESLTVHPPKKPKNINYPQFRKHICTFVCCGLKVCWLKCTSDRVLCIPRPVCALAVEQAGGGLQAKVGNTSSYLDVSLPS